MNERCSDCRRVIRPAETAYLVGDQVCCAQCHLKRELGLGEASFCTKCQRLIPVTETAYIEEAELVVCAQCTPRVPHERAAEIGSGWMRLGESRRERGETEKSRGHDAEGHPLLHILRLRAD